MAKSYWLPALAWLLGEIDALLSKIIALDGRGYSPPNNKTGAISARFVKAWSSSKNISIAVNSWL